MLQSKQNNPLYKADKNLLYTRDYFIESGLYLWRTSQVPSLVRLLIHASNCYYWSLIRQSLECFYETEQLAALQFRFPAFRGLSLEKEPFEQSILMSF